ELEPAHRRQEKGDEERVHQEDSRGQRREHAQLAAPAEQPPDPGVAEAEREVARTDEAPEPKCHRSLSSASAITKGVTRVSTATRSPPRSASASHSLRGRKCKKPGPKARKLTASRRCSTTTRRPRGCRARCSSRKKASRAPASRTSWA